MEAEVIIIYVPNDGNCYSFQARRNGTQWRYSKQITASEKHLSGLCQDFRESGWLVLDVREAADIEKPGMSKATPILIFRPSLDPRLAAAAMAELHRAILKSTAMEGSDVLHQ